MHDDKDYRNFVVEAFRYKQIDQQIIHNYNAENAADAVFVSNR